MSERVRNVSWEKGEWITNVRQKVRVFLIRIYDIDSISLDVADKGAMHAGRTGSGLSMSSK